MKKRSSTFLALLLGIGLFTFAQDWNGISVPANPGSGKVWQLQSNVSDDFNYNSTAGNRPSQFTSKWVDTYHNGWSGPGQTQWNKPQAWSNGNQLAIQAQPGSGGKVYCGIITSKNYIQYPIYMEIKAKIMDQVLANAFWTLTDDETQEIDIMEGYGSSRADQTWFAHRMHLSHHVFIRNPFTDWQPDDAGAWHYNGQPWRGAYHRYGCYWKDPWTLEYYIDGKKVRTVSGKNSIDPKNHTGGKGLNQRTKIIIDCENQTDWRPAPTTAELNDDSKNIFWVDWVRFYKPVNGSGGGSGGGDTGGGDTGGGSGTYQTLKGNNGRYVCSENGNKPITCNRTAVGGWEKFQFSKVGTANGNDVISIKGNNGRYVSSENGNKAMTCNRSGVGGWEKFELVPQGGNVYALKGNNGRYVSSENGSKAMTCNRTRIGSWEKFTINWNQKSAEATGEYQFAGFSIYPNPVTDELSISLLGDLQPNSMIYIYNSLGKVILTQELTSTLQTLSLTNLTQGIYILQVINGESVTSERFIKK